MSKSKGSPRKFSEKIALLNRKEAETNAEFERIIKEVEQTRRSPTLDCQARAVRSSSWVDVRNGNYEQYNIQPSPTRYLSNTRYAIYSQDGMQPFVSPNQQQDNSLHVRQPSQQTHLHHHPQQQQYQQSPSTPGRIHQVHTIGQHYQQHTQQQTPQHQHQHQFHHHQHQQLLQQHELQHQHQQPLQSAVTIPLPNISISPIEDDCYSQKQTHSAAGSPNNDGNNSRNNCSIGQPISAARSLPDMTNLELSPPQSCVAALAPAYSDQRLRSPDYNYNSQFTVNNSTSNGDVASSHLVHQTSYCTSTPIGSPASDHHFSQSHQSQPPPQTHKQHDQHPIQPAPVPVPNIRISTINDDQCYSQPLITSATGSQMSSYRNNCSTGLPISNARSLPDITDLDVSVAASCAANLPPSYSDQRISTTDYNYNNQFSTSTNNNDVNADGGHTIQQDGYCTSSPIGSPTMSHLPQPQHLDQTQLPSSEPNSWQTVDFNMDGIDQTQPEYHIVSHHQSSNQSDI